MQAKHLTIWALLLSLISCSAFAEELSLQVDRGEQLTTAKLIIPSSGEVLWSDIVETEKTTDRYSQNLFHLLASDRNELGAIAIIQHSTVTFTILQFDPTNKLKNTIKGRDPGFLAAYQWGNKIRVVAPDVLLAGHVPERTEKSVIKDGILYYYTKYNLLDGRITWYKSELTNKIVRLKFPPEEGKPMIERDDDSAAGPPPTAAEYAAAHPQPQTPNTQAAPQPKAAQPAPAPALDSPSAPTPWLAASLVAAIVGASVVVWRLKRPQ